MKELVFCVENKCMAFADGKLNEVDVIKTVNKYDSQTEEWTASVYVKNGDDEFVVTPDKLYLNIEQYKDGNAFPMTELCRERSAMYVLRKMGRNTMDGFSDNYYYTIENGEIIKKRFEPYTVVYENSTSSYTSPDFPSGDVFPTRETAYSFSTTLIKHEDGTITEHKGINALISLDDEQKALVSELENLLAKMKDAGVEMWYYYDDGDLHAVNTRGIEIESVWDVDACEDQETIDGTAIETVKIGTTINTWWSETLLMARRVTPKSEESAE